MTAEDDRFDSALRTTRAVADALDPTPSHIAVRVDDVLEVLRLVDEAIDDIGDEERAALDRLADASGFRSWMDDRIAEGRARYRAEMDATLLVLGLWVFATGGTDLDVVPA